MPALLELRLHNFESLRQVAVKLSALNVLVGPNGAGKSNFLDAIQFLGDSVRDDLVPALEERGGYDRVRFRGKTSGPVRIGVSANVTRYSSLNAPDEYSLSFNNLRLRRVTENGAAQDFIRRWESFRFKRKQGPGRRITINGSTVALAEPGQRSKSKRLLRSDSLGLSTLPRLASDEGGDEVTRMAELFSSFRVFDVDVSRAREPAKIGEGDALAADGSNLSSFLLHLSRDEHLFADLQDDARAFVPGLARLEFAHLGGSDDAVVVELVEEGLPGRTRLTEASYGTIRALALLAMLYDPRPPLLTCVEEIDHGLHPYVFERLVDRLRHASTKTQFLIATHSPALVNRLSPSELIVCERSAETGESVIPAADPNSVAKLAGQLEGSLGLGEIWFTGSLGGVPRE
jgi:predicted ATPase